MLAARPSLAALLLYAATFVVIALPVAAVVLDAFRSASAPAQAWSLPLPSLLRSLAWATLIGVLAAALALPLAWACRPRRSLLAPLLLAPALFPSALAYSGWGMLRAPLTATGDLIGRLRDGGLEWLPRAVDTTLAVGGLALWAAPLAAAAMLPGLRALSDDVLDAARLDAGLLARVRLALGLSRGPFALAALLVAAIMLGSAVPLHLARVETASILLWAQLDLTPPDRHWTVWLAAWPLLLAAAALAWLAAHTANAPREIPSQNTRHRSPRTLRTAALLITLLGTLGPLALFASNLRSLSAIPRYWRDHADAATNALTLAALASLAGVVLLLAAWHAAASGRDRLVRHLAFCWTFVGLLPGVLVGAAVARSTTLFSTLGLDLADTPIPLLLGHAARFGFLLLWLGLWLARAEPTDLRDQRRLDDADAFPAWAAATLPGAGLAPILAVAAALFALSLHEVESVVLTLQPGGSLLSRAILSDLHFFRTQQLAAGVVVAAGLFIPPAVLAALCLAARARSRSM